MGVLLIAAAVEGYLRGNLNAVLRAVAAVGALLLIDGGGMTDILGVLCLAVVLGAQVVKIKMVAAKKAAA